MQENDEQKIYDELNASVIGSFSINDPTLVYMKEVFHDFNAHVAELQGIINQFKQRDEKKFSLKEHSDQEYSGNAVWEASVNQAYQAGLSDLPESGVPVGATPAQRSAYEAGRAESIRRLEQELDSVSQAQADWFVSESGLVRDEFWKRAYLSSRDSRRIDALGKVLGVQIRFAETVADGRANAKYENGVITLALDAKDPVMTSVFHESVHRIRETGMRQQLLQ